MELKDEKWRREKAKIRLTRRNRTIELLNFKLQEEEEKSRWVKGPCSTELRELWIWQMQSSVQIEEKANEEVTRVREEAAESYAQWKGEALAAQERVNWLESGAGWSTGES